MVVIELKRTEDGGHMELQALRYAAMVSALTFERVAEVYGQYLAASSAEGDPRALLLDFLEWEEPDEERFAQDVRIVLASAEFSKELTTTVMWLNDHGLDIECVRLRPYRNVDQLLVDVQPIIPLPEAAEYQVRLRDKTRSERVARQQFSVYARDYTKYTVVLGGQPYERLPKRQAIFQVVRYLCGRGISPEAVSELIDWRKNDLWRSAPGHLDSGAFIAAVRQQMVAQGRRFDPNRYFCDDSELIHFQDRTYALTNQWGQRTEEAMMALSKRYPEHGVSVAATA